MPRSRFERDLNWTCPFTRQRRLAWSRVDVGQPHGQGERRGLRNEAQAHRSRFCARCSWCCFDGWDPWCGAYGCGRRPPRVYRGPAMPRESAHGVVGASKKDADLVRGGLWSWLVRFPWRGVVFMYVRNRHACVNVSVGRALSGWRGMWHSVCGVRMVVCSSGNSWYRESAKLVPTVSLASRLSFFRWPVHRARVALNIVVPLFFPQVEPLSSGVGMGFSDQCVPMRCGFLALPVACLLFVPMGRRFFG